MSINVEFDNSQIKKVVNKKIDNVKNYLLEKSDLYKSDIDIDNYKSRSDYLLGQLPQPLQDTLKSKIRLIFENCISGDYKSSIRGIQDFNSLLSSPSQRDTGVGWTRVRELYWLMSDLEDHIEAKTISNLDVEKELGKYTEDIKKEEDLAIIQINDLIKKINNFISVVDKDLRIRIEPRFGEEPVTRSEILYPLGFYVSLLFRSQNNRNSILSPGFSLFPKEDNITNYEIDDVIEWGDTDFFEEEKQMSEYFSLIEFLRSGKLPGINSGNNFIKLYRGMSYEEYKNWSLGEKIPKGKFFTAIPTAQFSQDIQGSPPELFSFRVREDMVVQTDENTYQLVIEGRLEGKKILPFKESKTSYWIRNNCKFSELRLVCR